jgi:hypothetical protein
MMRGSTWLVFIPNLNQLEFENITRNEIHLLPTFTMKTVWSSIVTLPMSASVLLYILDLQSPVSKLFDIGNLCPFS